MTSVAGSERAALVSTLRTVGPDAPTLCPGWTTRSLAAHLLARERRPDALLGIAVTPLAERRHRIERQIADGDWAGLVDRLAGGPPLYSPLRWLDRWANIHEMFVHHEDVRRAVPDWTPRTLDRRAVAALRRLAAVFGPVCMPAVPARVTFQTSDGDVLTRFGRGSEVTVSGDPGELLLFAFGRGEVVVDVEGEASAVDSVRQTERRF